MQEITPTNIQIKSCQIPADRWCLVHDGKQVIALAQDPDIDLARVADTVSADPAIAAKVMRIANSAMYARRRQSTNLRQALIVLGLNATLTLALSFTLVSALQPIKTEPLGNKSG